MKNIILISLMLIGVAHASQHCETHCHPDYMGGENCETQCYDY